MGAFPARSQLECLQQGEGRSRPAPRREEPSTESIMEAEKCAPPQQKIKIEQHTFVGSLWFAAWLFTIGYLHLHFWRGVLAFFLWPYFLGAHFSPLLR